MSIKEIAEAMKEKKVVFGFKQLEKIHKKKKVKQVFVFRETRQGIIKKIEELKLIPIPLKKQEDALELGIEFLPEVISII